MKPAWRRAALGACLWLAAHAALAGDAIHAFGADSYRNIVARHVERPLVVVVWSLDCDYCLPSFRALAEAQRRGRLAVVAITTDPADDTETMAAVRNKIAGTGLAAEIWAFGDAPAAQLRYAIDPKWRGEMPRSYWYDASGKMTPHSGVITSSLIERRLGGAR
ncbi:hypothetical protein E4K72_03040 [Oxalobacteraceae bacterium OM1]|nr:hypothetical protein E4K72_03040 [Oxalobacteraceae bacterium OM1]